jgi:group I intron endonuclease
MIKGNNSGIYIIFVDKYFYIGSSKNLNKRRREHLNSLKTNSHHNEKMQNVYNKYLKFDFQVLELQEKDELSGTEQTYIDMYFSFDQCLNLSKSADCPFRDLPKTESHRKALSLANKGKKPSEACIAAIKSYRTGSKLSDETKKKISLHNTGNKNYFYSKTGKDSPAYGRKNSDEEKHKKSVSKLGSLNPNFGKVFSLPILVVYTNRSRIIFKTTREASKFFGVSDRTVLRWIKRNPNKNQKSIFNNLNIDSMSNI